MYYSQYPVYREYSAKAYTHTCPPCCQLTALLFNRGLRQNSRCTVPDFALRIYNRRGCERGMARQLGTAIFNCMSASSSIPSHAVDHCHMILTNPQIYGQFIILFSCFPYWVGLKTVRMVLALNGEHSSSNVLGPSSFCFSGDKYDERIA